MLALWWAWLQGSVIKVGQVTSYLEQLGTQLAVEVRIRSNEFVETDSTCRYMPRYS